MAIGVDSGNHGTGAPIEEQDPNVAELVNFYMNSAYQPFSGSASATTSGSDNARTAPATSEHEAWL